MDSQDYDKNVYIVGAGFSASAGAPLLNDFLNVSQDLLVNPSDGLTTGRSATFQDVFAHKKKLTCVEHKVNIDLNNVEELFGLVEMEHQITETSSLANKVECGLPYLLNRKNIRPDNNWEKSCQVHHP